jgi:predicted nucleotide-binding protein (sugar kinase/HSP70/actin superfamily)
VDYDPGASEVNQLNRIKLMIAVAKANLAEKEAEARAVRNAARDGAPEAPEAVAETVEVETTEVAR